jgi:hypothetical protein
VKVDIHTSQTRLGNRGSRWTITKKQRLFVRQLRVYQHSFLLSGTCRPSLNIFIETISFVNATPLQRRRKWAVAAAAITTLCVQYIVFLMSQPQEKERAHCNELEVSNLIDYLHKHRSAVGEGGNFKMTTCENECMVRVLSHNQILAQLKRQVMMLTERRMYRQRFISWTRLISFIVDSRTMDENELMQSGGKVLGQRMQCDSYQ